MVRPDGTSDLRPIPRLGPRPVSFQVCIFSVDGMPFKQLSFTLTDSDNVDHLVYWFSGAQNATATNPTNCSQGRWGGMEWCGVKWGGVHCPQHGSLTVCSRVHSTIHSIPTAQFTAVRGQQRVHCRLRSRFKITACSQAAWQHSCWVNDTRCMLRDDDVSCTAGCMT